MRRSGVRFPSAPPCSLVHHTVHQLTTAPVLDRRHAHWSIAGGTMPVQRANPYGAYNFLVEIDSIVSAAFSEVEGLGLEIVYAEYRNGSDPANTVRKLPGLRKYTNITLKRGIT